MSNTVQKVRITEPGWGGYTGMLGTVEFADGISVEPVPPVTLRQLGAIVRLEQVDTETQGGAAALLQEVIHAEAEVVVPLAEANAGAVGDAPAQVETVAPTHTRESLEAIADTKGIAGLREIADPMGLKGRGILELIGEILAAQSKVEE